LAVGSQAETGLCLRLAECDEPKYGGGRRDGGEQDQTSNTVIMTRKDLFGELYEVKPGGSVSEFERSLLVIQRTFGVRSGFNLAKNAHQRNSISLRQPEEI